MGFPPGMCVPPRGETGCPTPPRKIQALPHPAVKMLRPSFLCIWQKSFHLLTAAVIVETYFCNMGLKLGENTCCPLGFGKDIIQIMLSGLSLLLIEKGHRTGYYIWVLNCWKWQLKFMSYHCRGLVFVFV